MAIQTLGSGLAGRLFDVAAQRIDASHHLLARRKMCPAAIISSYVMNRSDHGLTTPSETGDAYMAVVHLRARGKRDMWRDGCHSLIPAQLPGALTIHDMRHTLMFDLRDSFQTVNFQIPRWLLNDVSDDVDTSRVSTLDRRMAIDNDEVMRHLALAVLPYLREPQTGGQLFVDQLFGTLAQHLIGRYGDAPGRILRPPGGLAAWQERRAKEMLMANLGNDLTMTQLAQECSLSPTHFSRAFKISTGMAPYRWLTAHRLDAAKHLLADTIAPLSDIALQVGFADQSHFTKVFSRMVGTAPGNWRQTRKN